MVRAPKKYPRLIRFVVEELIQSKERLKTVVWSFVAGAAGWFTASTSGRSVLDALAYHDAWYSWYAAWLLLPAAICLFYILVLNTRRGLRWGVGLIITTCVLYPIARTFIPLHSPWALVEFLLFHTILAQTAGLAGATLWLWVAEALTHTFTKEAPARAPTPTDKGAN